MEVIPLVTFLLTNVTPLVKQEVMKILGAPNEVRSLHDELQFIEKRLKLYDDRFMEDNMVRVWLSQIQDLAHEAKNISEKFETKNDIQNRRNSVAKLVYGLPHVAMLREVATKVKRIKKKIEEIDGYEKKYCVDRQVAKHNSDKVYWSEKQRREVEEENVVGFGVAAKQVSKMLVNGRLRRDVISIVGTTGSGKTTLAKMIYGKIREQFQCHALIFAPGECRIRDLLLGILENLLSIGEEESKLEDMKLAVKLRKFLQGKRYLVVIDGVERNQLWQDLAKEKVFPDENNGSRLLLTTRSRTVASQASLNVHIHSLQPLDDEARWKLLQKLVFKDGECPQELVKLGQQIAAKCDGLPLAIVSLAILLGRDITYRRWLDIISNVSWYLNQEDGSPCFGVLDLTYSSVPEHLKECLLYLGVFPSGFEIPARQVINLWVAEELVDETSDSKAEEIAERYLEELTNLSLIKVGRKRSDGGVKTFQIHELWSNFCIWKSRRKGFLDVQTKFVSLNRPRKLSIHYDFRYILSNSHNLSNLESLLCFHNKDSLDSERVILHCHHFPELQVLDLGSTRVSKIHESIKTSFLLKYLKINHPSLNSLPPSLCSLPSLHTLDLKNTCVPSLPSGIWTMQKLRHLLLPPQTTLPKCPDHQPQKRLWHLQTLTTIILDKNTAHLIRVSKFPSLIKLTLNSQDEGKAKKWLDCLDKLDCLQNLKIINPAVFPKSGTFPTSLVKVTLVKTDLIADQVMGMLENLRCLQVLKLLTKSIRGPKLELKPYSFPQLRFLFMEKIVIKTWMMGDGAMDSLEELTITHCDELESLPKQLWQLDNIRQVTVNSPSQSLKQELELLSVKRCGIQINF